MNCLVLVLCASVLAVSRVGGEAVRWSAEIYNLSAGTLEDDQIAALEAAYAETIANALVIGPGSVLDNEGHSARVTLTVAKNQPRGGRHKDVNPESTVATTTTSTTSYAIVIPATPTTPTTPTTPATPTADAGDYTPAPAIRSNHSGNVIRGICYGALPCTEHACGGKGLASEDMLQDGYGTQWGEHGRDDLQVMKNLGANTVRLYHSLGLGVEKSHAGFLDRAHDLGMNVMAGYHTENANDPSECPGYDCFDTWKSATLEGFKFGFAKNGGWHPAVSALVLLNEPDFFDDAPKCQPRGAWCRVKAALSALDGVLAAEKEAGVDVGRTKFTVAWSFAIKTSIDNKVTGPGLFGFQDIVAGIQDPAIANYTPRASQEVLAATFSSRWIHGLNTQSPWDFVKDLVSKDYAQFSPTPWFIGEYGANGQTKDVIQKDLGSMQSFAESESDFLGVAFFQFQTTYWKGGAEMNFGLFALRDDIAGKTGPLCDKLNPNCRTWPVHCLTPTLSFLPADLARAGAVAAAWGGSVKVDLGFCGSNKTATENSEANVKDQVTSPSPSDLSTSPMAMLSKVPRKANQLSSLAPMRGICYGALPCTEHACGGMGMPSEDMLQQGYEEQWGQSGRNDLATMSSLGANAVRLYHSLGLNASGSHRGFLDRAQAVNLNVLAGYHTENANDPHECPGYDCYHTWKAATLQGFAQGLKEGLDWHPAVSMLILLNEPDFFEHAPKCKPSGAWCRVKAALSALDGVLAAEKEAGIVGDRVKLTVTWSFAMTTSVDGELNGPGIFGFQDMVAVIANPSLAKYTPRATTAELETAFRARWVHGLNTQAPWSFVDEMVSKEYARFAPLNWFIGEYGGMGQPMDVIERDLVAMEQRANEGSGFLGSAFFQFQTTYWKGGSEMNFGLFSLGSSTLGSTGELCDKMTPTCKSWPVHCLSPRLPWLSGTVADRAKAVALAWGGEIPDHSGICTGNQRKLTAAENAASVHISCFVSKVALNDAVDVQSVLGGSTFAANLEKRTLQELGDGTPVLTGRLSLDNSAVDVVSVAPSRRSSWFPWWGWIGAGAISGFLVFGGTTALLMGSFRKSEPKSGRNSSTEGSSDEV